MKKIFLFVAFSVLSFSSTNYSSYSYSYSSSYDSNHPNKVRNSLTVSQNINGKKSSYTKVNDKKNYQRVARVKNRWNSRRNSLINRLMEVEQERIQQRSFFFPSFFIFQPFYIF